MPTQQESRILARGGSLNLASAGISAVVNLALVVVATRSLGVDDAGRFFTVTSVFLVLQTVSRLGADLGLVYFLARFTALGTEGKVGACLRAAFVPVLAVSVALGAALVLAAPVIARLIVGDTDGGMVAVLRLLAVLLPVAAAYDLLLGVTRGYNRMGPTAGLEKVGRPLVQLAGMLAVAVTGGGAVALGTAWALPFVPFAVLALRAARRALPADRRTTIGAGGNRSVRAEFWRFTAPRSVAGTAQILLQRLDIVIVAALRGPGDAAIYAAATRFLVAGQLGNQAISTAVQPRLSALLARRELAAAGDLFKISTAWLVAVSWPIFCLAAVFAPFLLDLFGSGYDRGERVVVILGVAMLVATGCGVVSIVLIMAGRTMWNLWNTLLAVGLNIGIDLLLVPSFGITGAAIGWAVALLAANLVPLAQVREAVGLHPFGTATITSMALCGVAFGLVPLAVRSIAGTGAVAFAIALVTGTAVLLAGLWRCRGVLQLDALRTISDQLTRRRRVVASTEGTR